jgi:hypothetical protein
LNENRSRCQSKKEKKERRESKWCVLWCVHVLIAVVCPIVWMTIMRIYTILWVQLIWYHSTLFADKKKGEMHILFCEMKWEAKRYKTQRCWRYRKITQSSSRNVVDIDWLISKWILFIIHRYLLADQNTDNEFTVQYWVMNYMFGILINIF